MTGIEAEICNCAALRQAARHVTRRYDEALSAMGIGVNQYSILACLSRKGPSSVQELADSLVMDRSTLGHLARPLEHRGLVKLSVSLQDRRGRILTLTAAGKTLLAKAKPLWDLTQRRFESKFGNESSATLRRTLKRIATVDF
jgi:DNA-binding MarR family transcriptional regulator